MGQEGEGRSKKLTALLDAQAGVEYEGEEPPKATDQDHIAVRAFNLLANGMGGIDWSGLPVVVAMLGVDDVGDLLHRLEVIRTHRPPEDKDKHGTRDSLN